MRPTLLEETPLVQQYTSFQWVDTPCEQIGDERRIRLSIGQLVTVRLCVASDGSRWLVKVEQTPSEISELKKSVIRTACMPAIQTLNRIASLDSMEAAKKDRPTNIGAFKRFKDEARHASVLLRKLL